MAAIRADIAASPAGPSVGVEAALAGRNSTATVELLFPATVSVVAEETTAVFRTEPPARLGFACVTIVKVADAPAARLAMLHVTVPGEPTGGTTQVNAGPVFCTSETNRLAGGKESLRATVYASLGPLFVTVML